MDGSGPQIIVVQAPRLRRSYESYAGTAVMILGVVQIFNGLGSLGLGIANPLTCGVYGMIGDGIWCGVLVGLQLSFVFDILPVYHGLSTRHEFQLPKS